MMKLTQFYVGSKRALYGYATNVRLFRPNARLYLLSVVITGAAMGVFYLLFNFYVLSLGYDESLVGKLVTTSSLTALLAALPSGYLADQIGRKPSLLIAGVISSLSTLVMVLWPTSSAFYFSNIAFGIAQSLAAVTMGPFLMENSGEQERTYLFSFSLGLQMASASLGSWVGGYLPTWVANLRGISPTDSAAYAEALLVVSLLLAFNLVPLAFLHRSKLNRIERAVFTPIIYARKNPGTLSKLILPTLLTSIGAGLIMPFMNVFYRTVYNLPDTVIGTLFAWGSLAMGIGLLIAPPLAERMGKIQFVVTTQSLSLPFLVLMGFSPWFWLSGVSYYIRLALMNMSGPVYKTFVMEQVDKSARATVASLDSMSWSFGWAFSPMVSGWMQVNYGFAPAFMGTLLLYSVSVILYWLFFLRKTVKETSTAPMPGI